MTVYAPAHPVTDSRPITSRVIRERSLFVGAALIGAAAVVALVLLFRPWPVRNSFLYEELAPVRDAIWSAILVDALAFALVGLTLSLGVCLLAQGRGARLALLGAIVTSVGGLLFAIGAFAFAAFTWYATDPTALPLAEGRRFLEYAVANPEHLMLPQMLGFLLYTLGSLILAAALIRSRAIPRWLPIALVVATVAQFGVTDRALDFVQIGAMGVLIVVGVHVAGSSSAAR
jgi:hypothetical protein